MFGKRFARRPWGWWLVLLDRKHFKIKLLRFRHKKSCSRQWHCHRSELWLFLSGKGRFEKGVEESCEISAGEWINVGRRVEHQYSALQSTLVLEIQYGAECSEKDIVRV